MKTLSVALDWSPNTNHSPIYLAKHSGAFDKHDLDVQLLDPAANNYATTPGRLVRDGKADFAIGPSESIFSYSDSQTPMVAIASLVDKDTSAIIAHKFIQSPKDFDDKVYGSYQARLEDHIVKDLCIHSGGEGKIEFAYPNKFDIWPGFLEKKYACSWIFLGWEGAEIDLSQYNVFKLADYAIPYGYTPVLFCTRAFLNNNQQRITQFIDVLRESAHALMDAPQLCVEALLPYVREPHLKNPDFLLKSQSIVNKGLLGPDKVWGKMDLNRWQDFVDWIEQKNIFHPPVPTNELFAEI